MEELLGFVIKDVIIEYISGFELWCLKLTCKLCYGGISFDNVKRCLRRDICAMIKTRHPASFDIIISLLKQGIIKLSGTSLRKCFTHDWKGVGNLNIYVNKSFTYQYFLDTMPAVIYKIENDSLQYVSEFTNTFGIIVDQGLHIKSFDYFCNNVVTVRTRNCGNVPEFSPLDVVTYNNNNILMNFVIDNELFGFLLVVINKNRYTYKGNVYHSDNMIIPKIKHNHINIMCAKNIINLNNEINIGAIVGADNHMIFMEYTNNNKFMHHTKLFES